MKPIIIIAVAVGLGAIIVIIGGNYSVQNQTTGFMGMNDVKPWVGLGCDEMIDFSGSDEHHLMGNSMHMEFHSYYFDHCSETELGKP
jgi:hypothetical protein